MKHFNTTIPLTVVTVIGLLYLLQSCGGVHYDAYVEDYKEIAIKEMERTGYPASIKLAQAILESQGGRGKLALDYNNHFGILCGKNWPGKKYYQEEEDFNSGESIETCYRVFNNPYSSFIAHTDLMRDEYRPLFKIDPMDYERWAERLGDLKYTSNESYDATLISMIEKYNLYEFDEIAMGVASPVIAKKEERKKEKEEFDQDRKRDVNEYDRLPDTYGYEQESIDYDDAYGEANARYPRKTNATDRAYYRKEKIDRSEKDATWETPSPRDYEKEYEYGYNDRPKVDRTIPEEDYSYDTYDKDLETIDRYDRNPNNPQRRPSRDYTTTNRKRSSYDPNREMDSKYEGLSTSTYSNNRPAEYTTTPRYRKTYQEPIPKEYPSEDFQSNKWEYDTEESTSIDDFRMEEDFAYINSIKVTTARYDDTPLTIAKRFNISVKDVLKYNEQIRKSNQLLREDMKVYLAPKRKHFEGKKRFHIVQFGERMHNIAEDYGISLKALYEKNKMPEGSEPALGEKIKLDRGRIKRRPELRANYAIPDPLNSPDRIAVNQSAKPAKTIITDNFPNNTPSNNSGITTTVLLQPVTTQRMYHTVKSGETLYKIAGVYGTSVDNIKRMNNLTRNTISRGMRLKIK